MEDLKQVVYNSFGEAIRNYDEYKSERCTLYTESSFKPAFIWEHFVSNFVGEVNIINQKSATKIHIAMCCITSRTFPLVFDEENNSLYAFISYNRFIKNSQDLQKYVKALLYRYNDYNDQPELFDLYRYYETDDCNIIAQKLIDHFSKNISKKIESFNIIVFGVEKNLLVLLKSYLLDAKTLSIKKCENWMNNIMPSSLEITDASEKIDKSQSTHNLTFTEEGENRKNKNDELNLNLEEEEENNEDESENA